MNWILKADSLVKKYGDITAVDGISFEVFRGEIFGFLGPNGAGKTTTIKMMSGLLKPDSGNVIRDKTGSRRSIGICPQHIVTQENLTCVEQICFMGKMYNMSTDEVSIKGRELFDTLGLSEVKNRLAKNLSGGMKRRLNIALAMIHSPDVVFLDELQAGLDPQSMVLVREYIRSIKREYSNQKQDAISDSGIEIAGLFEARGIKNVILTGFHENICVIGRSFGLRNMVRLGMNVVLMRDLTDTIYNSKQWPFVAHYNGTGLMTEYIEKYVCPGMVSSDLTGKKQFRFKNDNRKVVAFTLAGN